MNAYQARANVKKYEQSLTTIDLKEVYTRIAYASENGASSLYHTMPADMGPKEVKKAIEQLQKDGFQVKDELVRGYFNLVISWE